MEEVRDMRKLDDKEQAMYIAKKFQKRMLIPKIFFISVAYISGAATLQEIVTNNNFLKKDIFFYYIYYKLIMLIPQSQSPPPNEYF